MRRTRQKLEAEDLAIIAHARQLGGRFTIAAAREGIEHVRGRKVHAAHRHVERLIETGVVYKLGHDDYVLIERIAA